MKWSDSSSKFTTGPVRDCLVFLCFFHVLDSEVRLETICETRERRGKRMKEPLLRALAQVAQDYSIKRKNNPLSFYSDRLFLPTRVELAHSDTGRVRPRNRSSRLVEAPLHTASLKKARKASTIPPPRSVLSPHGHENPQGRREEGKTRHNSFCTLGGFKFTP